MGIGGRSTVSAERGQLLVVIDDFLRRLVIPFQDLVAEANKLTGGKGARIVFDPVGGPTVAKLTAAMADRGILFLYGVLSTDPTPLPLMDVGGKSLTIRGYVLFEITGDPQRLERAKKFVSVRLPSYLKISLTNLRK